jgi:hypothetical protein
MVKAIYPWKPISRRPIERPKTRSVVDVRKDIQKLKVPNWKTLAQDRRRWKELVEKAKNSAERVVEPHKKKKKWSEKVSHFACYKCTGISELDIVRSKQTA